MKLLRGRRATAWSIHEIRIRERSDGEFERAARGIAHRLMCDWGRQKQRHPGWSRENRNVK